MMAAMRPSAAPVLDWDDLRIALAIAQSGTLSGAAATLHVSHPTLSRRLQRIERRLGTRLFDRLPSGMRITSSGEEVRQLALRMHDEVAALERRILGRDLEEAGPVRLTAPDAVSEYLLPAVLGALCKSHPGLQLELLVSNDVLPLSQRTADIALRVTSRPGEALRGRQVGSIAMAVYASRRRVPRQGAATSRAPWVGFDASLACSGPGRWLAQNVPDNAIRFRANTLLGAAQAVKTGIGFGVLPCFIGSALPDVVRIGGTLPELTQPLWLLMHADTASIPRVRLASAALAAAIRKASGRLTGSDDGERVDSAQHA